MTTTVKLQGHQKVTAGTMTFSFKKPAGFNFQAGQYLVWELINPPQTDAEGNKRDFTISSAPYEDFLAFSTRMRDTAFKRVLKNMSTQSKIQITGPHGDFTLPKDTNRPVVFLAGGIGITPFRSMILESTHDQTGHQIYLFYSNRTPQDAAFLEELQNLEKQNKNFKLIPTMTQISQSNQSKSKWMGEIGYIDDKMLKKHIAETDILDCLYYIAGPPAFVNSLREMLVKAGVKPEDVLSDSFDGY